VAAERNPSTLKAHEFMTHPVITIQPETDIADAAALMSKHAIRKLVVSQADKILGVLTARDLVRNLSSYVSKVFSEHFYML
ncbi:MAG: cyclic nucleotide-binding/CBS domain-containing protein, partial [Candidatus Bathyarchaeia archaeon]